MRTTLPSTPEPTPETVCTDITRPPERAAVGNVRGHRSPEALAFPDVYAERGEHAKRRGNNSDFLLSGLLRCGRCGKAYIGMSANGNGGRYHYYACTGRQKYGPKACTGERLPREKLETAVLHKLASVYRDEQLIANALAKAPADAETRRPEFEQQLDSTATLRLPPDDAPTGDPRADLHVPTTRAAATPSWAGSVPMRTRGVA
jgi:hypothetical protein